MGGAPKEILDVLTLLPRLMQMLQEVEGERLPLNLLPSLQGGLKQEYLCKVTQGG